MGCKGSKNKLDFSNVQEVTGMNKKEVEESFKAFKKETGSSKISLKKFTTLVKGMNTNKGGDVKDYAKHLFRVLDTDKDNLVSFQEVIIGFHRLSANANEKEKLELVFQMYDIDGNKALSAENVKTITTAQYKLQGKALDESEINQKVKNLFGQCDLNSDGKISEQEFYKSGKTVAEMFELEEND